MQASSFVRPIEILLVEDNRGDAVLASESLEMSKLRNTLSIVSDGVQAIDFLRRRGPYAKSPRPDLILLDLNLPRKDGREVLAEIKADPDLRSIPVVILTASKDEEDIVKAYDLHANCFVSKPLDIGKFLQVVRMIEDFWLTIVQLPGDGDKRSV